MGQKKKKQTQEQSITGWKELAVGFILWKLLTRVFQNYSKSEYGMWKTLWRNSKGLYAKTEPTATS